MTKGFAMITMGITMSLAVSTKQTSVSWMSHSQAEVCPLERCGDAVVTLHKCAGRWRCERMAPGRGGRLAHWGGQLAEALRRDAALVSPLALRGWEETVVSQVGPPASSSTLVYNTL